MQQHRTTFPESTRGFTLLEIMIVVGVIGMLAGIAVASFVKARTQAQTNICINNLIRVDSAKEQLALETGLTTGATMVAASVNTYIKGGTTPLCPASGTYTYGVLGSNPVCSVSAHTLTGTSSGSGTALPPATSPPRPPPVSGPVM